MSVGKAPVLTCPTNPDLKKQQVSIQRTIFCGLIDESGVPVKKICKKPNSTSVKGLKILLLSMQYIFISPIDTEMNY